MIRGEPSPEPEEPLTLDEVRTWPAEKITDRWDEVSALMRGPKPEPADFADPRLDLRTLTVEETNANWARVQELIREQAAERKEGDRLYRLEVAEKERKRLKRRQELADAKQFADIKRISQR